MATTYPGAVQLFPTMEDMTASDAAAVMAYQLAMRSGNVTLAQQYLAQIPNVNSKIINADYLNTINDTVTALQTTFDTKYSPAYIVSRTQPATQEVSDFWFAITG